MKNLRFREGECSRFRPANRKSIGLAGSAALCQTSQDDLFAEFQSTNIRVGVEHINLKASDDR